MHPRDRSAHFSPMTRPACEAGPSGSAPRRRRGVPRPSRAAWLAVLATLLAGAAPAFPQVDSTAATEPAPAVVRATLPAATTTDGATPAAADSQAGSAATAPIARPPDLRHVQDWVDYRTARHLASLPDEARVFYRRGLMARQAGQSDAAVLDVRGAAELDPSFIEPHLTLAAWTLTREPSQALLQYATVVDLLRQNFSLQLNLVANAAILLGEALFVGLLAAAMLVVWLRRRELTHAWKESVARFASRRTARLWAPALLVLPYLLGFGWTLPTLLFLGWLWPHLRLRERSLFVMLLAFVVATPMLLLVVQRMSLPLHERTGPFYAVPTLENRAFDPVREGHLAALAAHDSSNPIIEFGLAWTARRGGHLAKAEDAYRRVLARWPSNDRAWNNLGNVVAMAGRPDEALKCYEKAIELNPDNAAANYNASQIYTQRFEYARASEALSKATAANFELVKTYQSQARTDGLLPLVDEWLSPAVFWRALLQAKLPGGSTGSLPVSLRRHLETSGWLFSLAALLLAGAGVALGRRQQRLLPLRTCGNCGAVVCRRCAERRREIALCATCVQVESKAESGEFTSLMLSRHRMASQRRHHLLRVALATLVPGYGILANRHVFTAIALLSTTYLLGRAWLGTPPPFAIEPRLTLSTAEVPPVLVLSGFALVVAVSVLGYLRLQARERAREAALAASQRGRITQSTRRVTPEAA